MLNLFCFIIFIKKIFSNLQKHESLTSAASMEVSQRGRSVRSEADSIPESDDRSLPRNQSAANLPHSLSQTSISENDHQSSSSSQSQQTRAKEKQKVKKDRMPKVTLQSVVDENVAVCLFDTFKNVKITFKFGIEDDEPEEVADKMVRLDLV